MNLEETRGEQRNSWRFYASTGVYSRMLVWRGLLLLAMLIQVTGYIVGGSCAGVGEGRRCWGVVVMGYKKLRAGCVFTGVVSKGGGYEHAA